MLQKLIQKTLFALSLIIMLALSACDAGPSAVLPDGEGKSPSEQSSKTPFWAEDTKAVKTKHGDGEQVSNEVVGASPAPAPEDLAPSQTSQDIAAKSKATFGKWPLWSSNRKYSAIENAAYHYEKHGSEFGAKSYDDWLIKVHNFIHSPPNGTQTIKRNNGDTLMYDAKSNTFAVMSKKGAPRTMFHPFEGASYWQKQKIKESTRRTITRDNNDGEGEG